MAIPPRSRLLLAACLLLAVGGEAGCRRESVVLRAASPQGNGEALVVERASLDPPEQMLVLEPPDHRNRFILRHLGAGTETCEEIAWAADGSRVAFLISNRRLLVYDSGGNPVTEVSLLDPAEVRRPFARRVALSADGRRVEYDLCTLRNGGVCVPRSRPL